MKKNQKSVRTVVASSANRRTRRQTLRSALPELLESRTLMSTYLVTTSSDSDAAALPYTGSGPLSLRQAIMLANNDSGPDTINFAMTDGLTISLTSALPAITNTVTIDGTTQTGSSSSQPVELNGSNAGLASGLDFEGGSAGSLVKDLEVDGFGGTSSGTPNGNGIILNAPDITVTDSVIWANNYAGVWVQPGGSGAMIQDNLIGLDTNDQPTNGNEDGIDVFGTSSSNVAGVTISGNTISGNYGDGVSLQYTTLDAIQGNFIGTQPSGHLTDDAQDPYENFGNGITLGAGALSDTVLANVIDGSNGDGVLVNAGGTSPATADIIQGNDIGVDVSGTYAGYAVYPVPGVPGSFAGGNIGDGVDVLSGNLLLGGTSPGQANVIGGNGGDGVELNGGTSTIYGNFIGVGSDGTTDLFNGGNGVAIGFVDSNGTVDSTSSGNIIGGRAAGQGNVIADNGAYAPSAQDPLTLYGRGVDVYAGTGNLIAGNSIFGNQNLGIDLGNDGVTPNHNGVYTGPNDYQDFPDLESVTVSGSTVTVTGMLSNATQGSTYAIDLYNNASEDPSGYGQGQTWVGAEPVTIGTSGFFSATFVVSQAPTGGLWSATATDPSGNTSEFSQDFPPSSLLTSLTQLASNPTSATFGQSVTFTASVTGTGSSVPTGSVTFYDGVTALGTMPLNGNTASLTTSSLAVASHNITAVYSGDATYNSSSAALIEVVSPAASSTVLSVNPTTSLYGATVTLTATVGPTLNGTLPTGMVNFYDGSNLLGSGLLSGGVATYSTYTLGIGAHALVAQYVGDSNFTASNSVAVSQTVTAQANTISGTVYTDLTGNQLTADDTPLANVTVDLFQVANGSNTLVNSEITGSNGQYSFTTSSGTYLVQEVVPANTTETVGSVGYTFNATGGTLVPSENFDNFQNVSISGTMYQDLTGNGFSADDPAFAGGTVKLFMNGGATPVATTTTANNGTYSFPNLGPGSYSVQEVVPAGAIETGGNAGYTVSATSGSTYSPDNFDNFQSFSISGKVYNDLTGNGITSDDTALAGVTVQLLSGSTVVASTSSAADGTYSFANVGPGSYTVSEVVPSGSTQTAGIAGYGVTAQSGHNVTGDNFADFQNISVSGTTFQDVCGDGFSPEDPGMGGVTIDLFKNGGTTPVATTLTTSNGTYSFTNVGPGSYSVQEVVPANWIQTGGNAGYAILAKSGANSAGNNFDNFHENYNTSDISCISYLVNGCTKVTTLAGNTHEGDQVQVTFTVAAGKTDTISIVSYTAPDATFNASDAYEQVIFDSATGTYTGGTHTLCITIPLCYYQIDFVCGPVMCHFGPAGSNSFYHAQNRIFDSDNSGTDAQFSGGGELSGFVYDDLNGDKSDDGTDSGIAGVIVTLTGTDSSGHQVHLTRTTASNGSFYFMGLRAGTYTITETQPSGYTSDATDVGTVNGTTDGKAVNTAGGQITNIALKLGADGVSYDFGEIQLNCH